MSARVNPFFTPTQISGCSLWLDAADPTTMSFSGMNVTQWNDKSGNGRNATVFNASPTYSSGTKAVQFSGTQGLTTSLSASLTVESGFIVGSVTNVTTVNTLVGCFNANGGRQFRINNQLQTIKQDIAVVLNSGTTLSNSTLYILEFTNDGTTLTHYLTGSSYASGSSVSYDAGRTTSIGLRYGPPPVEGMTGSIFEICMYTVAVSTFQRQQVEGYLAWKWGLQSSLPANHPYKTSIIPPLLNPPTTPAALVQNTTPTWLPTQISGCSVWLDAADPSSISFSSGSNVSSWNDKSGNGRNATPLNGTTTYTLANGMTFNGSAALQLSYTGSPTLESLFVVIKFNSVSAQASIFAGTASGQREYLMFSPYNPGTIYLGRYGTAPSGSINGGTVNTTANYLLGYVFNGTANTISFYQAGSVITSGIPQFTYSSGGTTCAIGSYNGGGFLIGQIYELLVYNTALTTAQRQQVEGYLAWKWSLVSSLASSNVYKISPPFIPAVAFPARSLAQTAGFNPLRISGCTCWLDASDLTSLTVAGTTISQWRDKALSRAFNGTATSASTNSFACVRFNGSQGMTSATTFSFAEVCTNAANMICFLVVNVSSLTGGNSSPFALNVAQPRFIPFYNTTGGVFFDAGNQADPRLGGSFTNNVRQIHVFLRSGITTLQFRLNGSINASFTFTNPANYGNQSYTGFLSPSGAGGTYVGDIHEIVYYSTEIGLTNLQQVEGYLAWKWGLQGSLPATHPWKQYPPPPS